MNIDLFTTCLKAAGIESPTDRTIDEDMTALFHFQGQSRTT